MPKSILELFSQKEVLNYLKNRTFKPMIGEELYPEVKKPTLEFDVLKSNSKTPVIASVHAFNTESEIGTREAEKMALEACLIKRKMQLKEEEIIKLQQPRNEAEKKYLMQDVYNDIENLVQSIRARIELMRMELTATGKVTLNENGLNATINYGIPDENKISNVNWNLDTANPIQDMINWRNKLDSAPDRVLTSTTVLAKLLSHKAVVNALFGKDTSRIASVGELNNYLQQLRLPKIYVYDEKYRKQKKDGKGYEKFRYFPENAFVMLPAGPLGETLYGPTAEEIRLQADPTVDIQSVGKILAMVYDENKDPVSTWKKAVATAIPSLSCGDEIFQATLTLA